jgi:thioredoxin reductase (NADPH)
MAISFLESRREQMFPKLSAAQIARLQLHSTTTSANAGEVLIEPGDAHRRMLVVLTGSLELMLPGKSGEELFVTLVAGDFTGEMSTLRGVDGFVRVRAHEDSTLLEIDEHQLRLIVQTDAEISEMFMRAFILRRMGLVSSGQSDVMLLGSQHSGDTLRLREFLTRNSYPYLHVDVETDPDARELLERFHLSTDDIPVLIGRGGRTMRNPSNHDAAGFLNMNPQIDATTVRDVVIVGAGPAGLAAAVYAASEGLDVLVIESNSPGGQAGSSSKIENYLGFPTGISGQALAGRALVQAQKFGATVGIACDVEYLDCERTPYSVRLSNDRAVLARSVIIATGAQYRKLSLENLQRFTGTGVYYAATHLEARLCQGEEIIVVGGGNSAGQAAVFLAGACRRVHVVVRAAGLADTMSQYLIRRIEDNPNITLHTRTQITALEGSDRLERVSWRTSTGAAQTHPISHVFLMAGAVPNTQWLQGCVAMDEKGFVRTGADLHTEDLAAARWPLKRSPSIFETTLPGVFAVGDVRSGSVKRIASGVGEGSVCVQFVHRALKEFSDAVSAVAANSTLTQPAREETAVANSTAERSNVAVVKPTM